MAVRIWVQEEFGYREWMWTHPGTVEDVVADWKAGRCPISFWGLREAGTYQGTCEKFDPNEDIWGQVLVGEKTETEAQFLAAVALLNSHEGKMKAYKADLYAHVHVDEDTYLMVQETAIYQRVDSNQPV